MKTYNQAIDLLFKAITTKEEETKVGHLRQYDTLMHEVIGSQRAITIVKQLINSCEDCKDFNKEHQMQIALAYGVIVGLEMQKEIKR